MKLMNKRGTTLGIVFGTMSRSVLFATVCAAGLGTAITQPVKAQSGQTVSVAVVDEDKLADGFTKYQAAIKALESRSQGISDQLGARALLNADEAKDFESLVTKATLTADDQTKIAAYVKTSNDRNAEYISLNGKVTKTDADNARIKALRDIAAGNQEAVGALSDKLYANLKQQQDDTDKNFTDQAKAVIIKVAKDRKFTLVVRSRGIIWNIDSIDITADVLKQLNQQ